MIGDFMNTIGAIALAAAIAAIIYLLLKIERLMKMSLEKLTTEVSEISTVIDSAIALITGLAQQIRDLSGNADALNALADQLDGKANALSAAVAANTPAAPDTTA